MSEPADGPGTPLLGRHRAAGGGYRRVVGAHRAPGTATPSRGYLFTVALLAGTASMPILAAISAGSATVGSTALPDSSTPFIPTPSVGPVVVPLPTTSQPPIPFATPSVAAPSAASGWSPWLPPGSPHRSDRDAADDEPARRSDPPVPSPRPGRPNPPPTVSPSPSPSVSPTGSPSPSASPTVTGPPSPTGSPSPTDPGPPDSDDDPTDPPADDPGGPTPTATSGPSPSASGRPTPTITYPGPDESPATASPSVSRSADAPTTPLSGHSAR
ncbi:hypothetical protein ACIBTV_17850 [Micromonospora sp. NPDC049366]|uniref:hypothetical protein n=1 Tax=Micromonospora sp. NPDC049366 TaxID=3364271 RepID=UPI0037ACEF9B